VEVIHTIHGKVGRLRQQYSKKTKAYIEVDGKRGLGRARKAAGVLSASRKAKGVHVPGQNLGLVGVDIIGKRALMPHLGRTQVKRSDWAPGNAVARPGVRQALLLRERFASLALGEKNEDASDEQYEGLGKGFSLNMGKTHNSSYLWG